MKTEYEQQPTTSATFSAQTQYQARNALSAGTRGSRATSRCQWSGQPANVASVYSKCADAETTVYGVAADTDEPTPTEFPAD